MIDDIIQKQVEELRLKTYRDGVGWSVDYEYAKAHLVRSMKKVGERIAEELKSIPHGQAVGAWGEYVSYLNVKNVINSITDKGE